NCERFTNASERGSRFESPLLHHRGQPKPAVISEFAEPAANTAADMRPVPYSCGLRGLHVSAVLAADLVEGGGDLSERAAARRVHQHGGPRQTMYCVGAPATHYFPVSIPYHGCALNITVQSYLDQLDFGLVACRETVPDAQRIADLIGEDFAAMRKADANLRRPEAIETIAAAARPAPVAAHKPIELVEAKAEPRTSQADKGSTLTRNIEALSVTTEALLRQLDGPRAPATTAAKARGSRPKTKA